MTSWGIPLILKGKSCDDPLRKSLWILIAKTAVKWQEKRAHLSINFHSDSGRLNNNLIWLLFYKFQYETALELHYCPYASTF